MREKSNQQIRQTTPLSETRRNLENIEELDQSIQEQPLLVKKS